MSRESSTESSNVLVSKINFHRGGLILGLAVSSLALSASANAQTYSVLYAFTGQANDDGAFPRGLVEDKTGNLYGITRDGGLYDDGTLFKIDTAGNKTTLTTFDYANGAAPQVGLAMAGKHLYADTVGGGYQGAGTVVQMSTKGKVTVRYNFCSLANCTDGEVPLYGPTPDSAGNLFGTTQQGGLNNKGVIFKVDPTGKETVLYSFCPGGGTCSDGEEPFAGAIEDSAGNLYGTAQGGPSSINCSGGYPCGVVWKLDASGNETVLHAFTGAPDGASTYISTNLAIDSSGNLYGTTPQGGNQSCNCGTIFKIDASGNETVIYNFTGGNDGRVPEDTLVLDKKGNLYGAAGGGGAYGRGTVFKLSKSGQFTTLYSFQGQTDGGTPQGGLFVDKTGVIYGATYYGGDLTCGESQYGCGVVFKITP